MKVGIAGLGLIGGSLALALRRGHQVVGWSPSRATRDLAMAASVQVVERIEDLLPADVIVVAAPLAEIVATLERLAPAAGRAILLDVASLKRPVAELAERLPSGVRIVGGRLQPANVFRRRINPAVSIPPTATAIHHIDDAAVPHVIRVPGKQRIQARRPLSASEVPFV